MAVRAKNGPSSLAPGSPKKSRQGQSSRTLLSATSRNGKKKKNRGQGNI
jgi:hypothetical protein